ncbi:MAG: UDP-N-acetylmuramate--L-alanine ligase, partial [Longimicrobiales bacterium]
VSGCDLNPGAVGERLRAWGAQIRQGQDTAHIDSSISAVIATAAVPFDHPELVAARDARIPVLKRAQALGALVNEGTVIAIAGTHGKTTTTAMTTAILAESGLQPTGFVGGRVPGWDSGLHRGSDQLFVVEADEYDRSFLLLKPTVAVVTTLEADHLDIYGSLEGVEEAFREFINLVSPGAGLIVACSDEPGVRRLLQRAPAYVDQLLYGTESSAQLRAVNIEVRGRGSRMRVLERGADLGELTLAVAGHHNIRNALAATAAALYLGASFPDAQRALARFTGVERRFQELGRAQGIVVVDDYAHHPTEIRATLAAARAAYAGHRLVAVFQPHLFSRTRDFAAEFGAALATADQVWVTDVYPARETPIPGVTGRLVADAAQHARAGRVQYEPDIERIAQRVQAELRTGDVALFMGAGSIDAAARDLLQRLRMEVRP